tara:strand:+ start:226 stop:417 length:192 start_codon:yes stop_codon:yes gene_type:complete
VSLSSLQVKIVTYNGRLRKIIIIIIIIMHDNDDDDDDDDREHPTSVMLLDEYHPFDYTHKRDE